MPPETPPPERGERRNNTTPVPPPLKWAGGKRWQVPRIRRMWLSHRERRLVEPFCGGLAVTLGLLPRAALLNDINPHLINFYRWLKRGFAVRVPLENHASTFYSHRARFNALLAGGHASNREAAALFYYLNRTGYNGLCRFNRTGAFNVPFGRYKAIRYVRDFTPYREAFAGWSFTSSDFERVRLAPDDFVYADPPYDVEFRGYAKEGFTWADQVRAAAWLARHHGPVILVNQATPRIQSLYRGLGYQLAFVRGPRRISCNGDRAPAEEVIATRNL